MSSSHKPAYSFPFPGPYFMSCSCMHLLYQGWAKNTTLMNPVTGSCEKSEYQNRKLKSQRPRIQTVTVEPFHLLFSSHVTIILRPPVKLTKLACKTRVLLYALEYMQMNEVYMEQPFVVRLYIFFFRYVFVDSMVHRMLLFSVCLCLVTESRNILSVINFMTIIKKSHVASGAGYKRFSP